MGTRPPRMDADTLSPSGEEPLLVESQICLSSSPAVRYTAAANSPVPGTAEKAGQTGCRGMDSTQAHERAELAFRKGQYREAGQCYLIAGDKPRADLALVKAAAAETPITKRQLAANANHVKEQFRQFREAFTSH